MEVQGRCEALTKFHSGIFTYGEKGVAKPGIKKDQHAIVYANAEPKAGPNELPTRTDRKGMRTPIKVKLQASERLSRMARVDYGRMFVVPHDIKAKEIGTVHRESRIDLEQNFAAVLGPRLFSKLESPEKPQDGPKREKSGTKKISKWQSEKVGMLM